MFRRLSLTARIKITYNFLFKLKKELKFEIFEFSCPFYASICLRWPSIYHTALRKMQLLQNIVKRPEKSIMTITLDLGVKLTKAFRWSHLLSVSVDRVLMFWIGNLRISLLNSDFLRLQSRCKNVWIISNVNVSSFLWSVLEYFQPSCFRYR